MRLTHLSAHCHSINYRHYVAQQISRTYSSCVNITVCQQTPASFQKPLKKFSFEETRQVFLKIKVYFKIFCISRNNVRLVQRILIYPTPSSPILTIFISIAYVLSFMKLKSILGSCLFSFTHCPLSVPGSRPAPLTAFCGPVSLTLSGL